jgi:hypothetical protein
MFRVGPAKNPTWFLGRPEIADFWGVWAAPEAPRTSLEGGGAKPPHLPKWFLGPHFRCPASPNNMYLNPKCNVNGPKTGSTLRGPKARDIWNRLRARSHQVEGPNWQKPGPRPGPGYGGVLRVGGRAGLPYCFGAGNRPSGPDFGRTAIVETSKSALRPARGLTSVLLRKQSGRNPAKKSELRPGSILA